MRRDARGTGDGRALRFGLGLGIGRIKMEQANELLTSLWREWWSGDIWIAPWKGALAGLTPEQADSVPPGAKHSIWQLVNHVMYWRNVTFARVAGETPSGLDPVHDEQFPRPEVVDADSWSATVAALEKSHRHVEALLDRPDIPLDRIKYHLAHDAYHLGQIMQLRALQGLPPVL